MLDSSKEMWWLFPGLDASYDVVPLLFTWTDLRADQIKTLMRINDGDNQL